MVSTMTKRSNALYKE